MVQAWLNHILLLKLTTNSFPEQPTLLSNVGGINYISCQRRICLFDISLHN